MLNKVNGRQELDRVNMLIRALSDEVARERARRNTEARIPTEMNDALYELRVRKLFMSAMVGSARTSSHHTRH